MSTLIWLDPGATTGVATFTDGRFGSYQMEGLYPVGAWLDYSLSHGESTLSIGWESYLVAGPRSAESAVALKVIGVAQYLALKHHAVIVPEVPSSMRKIATRAALERIGWWKAGQRHANDAAAHLLAHLVRTGAAPAIVRLAFTDPGEGGTP